MSDPRIMATNTNTGNRQPMTSGQNINARSNPGGNAQSVGQMSSYGVARSGMNQIHPGDIVRGEITDLRGNEISIVLENNTVIKGQIADSSNLSIGQTAAFRFNSQDASGILLEAISNSLSDSELTLINKALEEAGLPSTERNQSAVRALMNHLLPINKQSIQHLMQQAYDYGTEDMETLCLMNRNHLEITPDSVAQYSSFRLNQQNLMNKALSFSQELPQLLNALSENGPSGAVAAFGDRLLSITLTDIPQIAASAQDSPTSPSAPLLSDLSTGDWEAVKALLSETPLETEQILQLNSGEMSQKEALALLRQSFAGGTLVLPEDCPSTELSNKMQEITRELSLLPEPKNVSPESTSAQSSAIKNPATEESSLPPGQEAADSQKDALSFAGRFFHNISDAAKSSFQTFNQNINQLLAPSETGNIALTHTPTVLDTMLSNIRTMALEDNQLFTYMAPEERQELAKQLQELKLPTEQLERILKGELSTRETLQQIQNRISSSDATRVQTLFQSEVFQKLFTQSLLESFTLTPKQLAQKKELNSFYENMETKLSSYETLIKSALSGDDSRQLSDQAHDMKENIDFMKMLNETFSYMQLPLKLENQHTCGDLYVYTKKEKLKENSDHLSLLLHLEMEHLGKLDIRLEKDKNHILADFKIEDEKSLRLIENNTHVLENTLAQKGYTSDIKVNPLTQQETPLQDFLNAKVSTSGATEMKRFSFDIRA